MLVIRRHWFVIGYLDIFAVVKICAKDPEIHFATLY